MFVKAIADESLSLGEDFCCDKGDEIYGICRSYDQNTITVNYFLFDCKNKGCTEQECFFDCGTTKQKKVKIKQDSIERIHCYYNEDGCKGQRIVPVHTHHNFLCISCKKEEDSIPDEILDTGYHAMDYMRDWD